MTDTRPEPAAPRLSVIVPAYNEEAGLARVVRAVLAVGASLGVDFEVIVVDDGSTDGTWAIAQALAAEGPVRGVRSPCNEGSGLAIRRGVAAARGTYVIYVPADGQFDVGEIGRYLDATAAADIVVGARLSRSDYTWFRLLSSHTFLTLVRLLFGTRLRDVNWVHLWDRELFQSLPLRSAGVFMLEEILVRASRAGATIAEVDSRYLPRQGGQATGGNLRTILKTIGEMLALRVELWRRP